MKATARKLRADGKGVETEVPLDDWIDVGHLRRGGARAGATPKVLYLQKQHVTGARRYGDDDRRTAVPSARASIPTTFSSTARPATTSAPSTSR